MITTTLLNIVNWFSSNVISLLPDVVFSDEVLSSVQTASGYLSALNVILPISTLVAIMGLFLAVEGAILAVKVVNWFIRKIPMVN